MTTNPYAAPVVHNPSVDVTQDEYDLPAVAIHFRNLNCCVALGFFSVIVSFFIPIALLISGIVVPLAFLTAYIFSVLLSLKIYGVLDAVVRMFLSIVPLLNLIVFLDIHFKAKGILHGNGYKIGFFGATLPIPQAEAV